MGIADSQEMIADWRARRRYVLAGLGARAEPVRNVVRGGLDRALSKVAAWDEAVRSRWPFTALAAPGPGPLEPADSDRLLVRPAILGFVAVVAITVGSSFESSPFALKMPGAWFFGVPATGQSPGQGGLFIGLVAVYGGLLLLMRVWFGLVKTLSKRPGIPVRKLVAVFALWVVPLLVAPPLFSRDVYSYAAQGEMVAHHIDPYRYGPDVMGAGPFVTLVDPLWGNTPAPYGPAFLAVDGFLTTASHHNELVDVVLLRLLELAGVALLAWGVPALARSVKRDPGEAFVLALLNPVTVLHLIGGAHNDALMLGLLVAGLVFARRNRPVVGILLCTLATAVKVPAALGIVYIGWEWMGPKIPWRERVRPVVTAGLISLAAMEVLSLVTGLGWSWVLNLATPGTVRSWLAPATAVGLVLGHLVHGVGVGVPVHVMLSLVRVLSLLAAGVAGLWLLWNSERVGSLRAMGITFLLVVILGPVVQPWYLSWGLIVLAPVAVGKIRSVIIALSISSAFIGLPGGKQLFDELVHANPLAMAAALLVLLAVLTVPLTPWDRQRLVPPKPPSAGGDRSDVPGLAPSNA